MKSILIITTMLFTLTSIAHAEVEFSCSVSISALDEGGEALNLTFEVINDGGSLNGVIKQGGAVISNEKVSVFEESVREGLVVSPETFGTDINTTELLVLHAQLINNDPITGNLSEEGPMFDTGISDMSLIRSAKTYIFGELGPMGGTALIIAKDENDAELGAFLGGFLVGKCN